MKFIDKIKDRYNILLIILTLIFVVMVFKLAELTITHGEEYREKADNTRNRTLIIKAPKGEIRDRYGRLLAGNKPTFTVQLMKDELDDLKVQERNKTALRLVRLLEKEGENYTDEFPIELNVLAFKDDDEYDNDKNPEDEVIKKLLENNLIDELLQTYFYNESEDDEYVFMTAKKAVSILEKEGITVPIIIEFTEDGNIKYSYDENQDIVKWKRNNKISDEVNPKNNIKTLLLKDEKNLKKLLDNPIVRGLAYEILNEKDMADEFVLIEYSYEFDESYREIKRNLMNEFSNINMETSAKEDFVNIVFETYKDDLFTSIYSIKDTDEEIIPGKILFDKLKENGIDVPVIQTIDYENKSIEYKYKDEKSKRNFIKGEGLSEDTDAITAFIYLGEKNNIINEVITDSKVKYIAQKLMLNNGTNPKISITKWEYTSLINKENWLGQYKGKYKIEKNDSPKEAFNMLMKKYEIDESLSKYEARYILTILQQLSKQRLRAYEPINIAYRIKEATIAQIKENNLDLPGVNAIIEPTRYYPMGETAAHVLGYLGKISQSFEIDKYLNDPRYFPSDIIGKTGIEESFEKELKGEYGTKKVEVDVLGNTIKVLDKVPAKPGNNVYLTIDAELQKVAEEALKHAIEEIQIGGEFKSKWGNYNYKDDEKFENATSGSTVAIDVKTGEILAIANYPAYDPNLFATGISTEDWESLKPENEKDQLAPRPLLNIALQSALAPGSVFKMITAFAALESGIDPYNKILAKGVIEYGSGAFRCWIWNLRRGTHGPTDMFRAIAQSCNYYFYKVSEGIEDEIIRVAKEFGLNDKTGIEIKIPREKSSGVPNPENKVNSSKREIKKFLDQNIDYYLEDAELDDNKKDDIIKEVASWATLDEIPKASEIRKRLIKLGLNADKKRKGSRETLTDIIKFRYLYDADWKIPDTYNTSIGQGENKYTPIQMANYIATIANNGYKHKVSVVSKLEKNDGEVIKYEKEDEVKKIDIKDESFDIIKEGMYEVTTSEGTAGIYFRNFPVKVAGKTGTAQAGNNPGAEGDYDPHAWFVAFAPYGEDVEPEIAVATLIFQGGHGGYAAPVTREIIAQYLGLNKKEDNIDFTNKLLN